MFQNRVALRLDGTWTKNRKSGFQPIPADLVLLLSQESAGKKPDDRLLHVPTHPSRVLDIDLKKAGIAKMTGEGKLDFHAFRNTFATLAIESGANPKEAQSLMRHSTIALTMNTYARSRDDRLHEVAEKVGEKVVTRKTAEMWPKQTTCNNTWPITNYS